MYAYPSLHCRLMMRLLGEAAAEYARDAGNTSRLDFTQDLEELAQYCAHLAWRAGRGEEYRGWGDRAYQLLSEGYAYLYFPGEGLDGLHVDDDGHYYRLPVGEDITCNLAQW